MYRQDILTPTFLVETNYTFPSVSCQVLFRQRKNLRFCESKRNCVNRSSDVIILTKTKGN